MTAALSSVPGKSLSVLLQTHWRCSCVTEGVFFILDSCCARLCPDILQLGPSRIRSYPRPSHLLSDEALASFSFIYLLIFLQVPPLPFPTSIESPNPTFSRNDGFNYCILLNQLFKCPHFLTAVIKNENKLNVSNLAVTSK